MGTESKSATVARFGPYALDIRSGELRKHKTRVRLGEQPFQILCLLLERQGTVVSREEFRARLWSSDTFVDFDHGLNSAMGRLREALADPQAASKWIETLPRRGYRFIGEFEWIHTPQNGNVETGEGATKQNHSEQGVYGSGSEKILPSGNVASGERPAYRKWIAVAAVVAMLVAVGLWRLARKAEIRSLAVLPLESLSKDPGQEYVADGMTDELITELAKTRDLRVISRTSVMQYKNAHRPLKEIARELGADAIVEGTVARNENEIRVTVQLIQAATDSHLWAQSYERNRGDEMELEDELARNIATELHTTLTTSGRPPRKINPEAHDAYLRGRYDWFLEAESRPRSISRKRLHCSRTMRRRTADFRIITLGEQCP